MTHGLAVVPDGKVLLVDEHNLAEGSSEVPSGQANIVVVVSSRSLKSTHIGSAPSSD